MFLKAKTFIFTFAFSLFFYFTSCKEDKKVIKQPEISFTKEGELTIHKITSDSLNITIDIEIADTEYDIQTGLMYRNTMAKNQGMLFVFDDISERSFYMKNTRIPLDLIFIDDKNTIASFQKNAKPFDESSLPSNASAKYVLEINAGLIDTWKINVGDSINYK